MRVEKQVPQVYPETLISHLCDRCITRPVPESSILNRCEASDDGGVLCLVSRTV